MKRWLRSGPLSALLGWAIWAYMALCGRTIRWRILGVDAAKAIFAAGSPVIFAAWHSQILLLPAGWTRQIRHWPGLPGPRAMMISLSADGEPVAAAIRHLGLDAIRGSARNKRKGKDKGGQAALSAALGALRAGGALCVTPDGPRGPAQRAGRGAALMAKRAGAVIIPYALAARPAARLNTWDRFLVPAPFGKGAIVFGDPIDGASATDVEAIGDALQHALDHANDRAEELMSPRTISARPRAAPSGKETAP